MKQRCLDKELRGCPYCGTRNSIQYYHEMNANDLYYCNKCYGIIEFDGYAICKVSGEAYPNRDKKHE
jgi:hypothetical protein